MPAPILERGIQWILWLQQFSPALDWPMSAITLLGEATAFLLLIPLLYWSLDRRLAVRVALLLILSMSINGLAKALFDAPRPYQFDARVLALDSAAGGGMPSGHTQNAVVFWGYIALWVRRRWTTVLAALCLILVPLSRLYLGMHFPTDLLGGYLLGGAVLLAWRRLEPAATRRLDEAGMPWKILLTGLLPALLVLGQVELDSSAVLGAPLFLGMAVGYHLQWPPARDEVAGPIWQRALRFIVGLGATGAAAILCLTIPWLWLAALAWALLGMWATVGVPWLFVRLGLAPARPLRRRRGGNRAP